MFLHYFHFECHTLIFNKIPFIRQNICKYEIICIILLH